MRARLLHILIALIAFSLYAVIGRAVSSHALSPIDTTFLSWNGHELGLAWFLTNCALLPELAAVGIITLAAGCIHRAWLARCVFAVALDLLAWRFSDIGKGMFHRARPLQWFYHHETSFSYASGHATHAVVVYGLWAYFFLRSRLPLATRCSIAAFLVCLAAGISWSRLALGAHYATDVLGGWFLGIALISTGFALIPRVAERPGTAPAPAHYNS